jgi:hypothetical protein
MRLLTTLVLFACAVSSLTGCCHRRHSCFHNRFSDCVDRNEWDDDREGDCCPPCGCDPCGSPSTHFGDQGAPWTSDCGCTAPGFNPYPAAPMTYGAPMNGGCNCDAQIMPTFQQPVYMQAPTAEPTPTPATTPETYYSPRPGGNPPPAPPMTTVPTRF